MDDRTAERFVWGEGDIVIVKPGDEPVQKAAGFQNSARPHRVLTDADLRLAEEIDKRRVDES